MAGGAPNNPYLDTYLKYSEDPDPVEATRFRRSRRAARYARYQKQLENTAKATEAQSSFGQGAPVELTPVEKRMKATQDAYESEIKRYGAPDPQTAVEFANTRDPRMVQSQLDQEAQDKKDSEEFWSAVESGSQQHIDAALEGTGPAWDNLRKQKAEVDASRDHLKTLDPNTNADEILRAKPVLESAYAKLAEEEKRLNDFAAKVEKGIGARHAAGLKEAEGLDTIGARYSKVAIPTITGIGKALQRVQRGVAGQLGAASDILTGRGPSLDAIPGVAMFTDSGEARGEQAGKQWGEALAPAFDKAAFVTRKAIGGMETLSELGGLGGATPLGLLADTVTGVEKPEGMSDEEWNATGKDAMRAKLYGKTAATTFFETITDPLALVDIPFGKILKPFEKFLDKVKPAMLPKLAGKIREVVLGGHAIEDPRWAKSLVAEQALNLDRTAPMYEKALKAQRELQAAFDALPPEIAEEVRDTAPRVLEGIPVAERGGVGELLAKPVDYAEVPVYHGTARAFDALDTGAKRVAILDKPGRGEPVRGIFFSPHKDVAENYVRYAIPRVMAEARAGRVPAGVWRGNTIAESYGKRGLDTDALWANTTAERMFTEAERRNPLAWRSDAAAGKLPFGKVALFSDTPIEGGRVFQFTRENQKELEASLLKIAQDSSLHDKAYIFTKTPAFDPRVVQTTLKGRLLDLTDARAWPKDLAQAIRASSHSEDARIAKVLDKALERGGKFPKLNTIERSPALQKWVKDQGFDIIKKPEMDEITGKFSYWAISDDAIKGTKYTTPVGPAPSTKYAEVLKNIPPEHRTAAVKYAEAVGNDAAALKAMAADNGVSLEMASDRLQGYITRRFHPEYQRWLALHPEVLEKWDKFRLSNLEGRNAREYTFHEVEDFLRKETPEYKGDIWSREHDKLAGENWVILADAVKSRNQIEAFAEVFGKSADGNIPEGAVLGEQLAEQLGLRDPIPALKGKWFSKADVAQLKALRAPDVPGAWRARINRVTSWVSKAVLANPASLAKDVKGQAMNFWNATGAEGAAHLDEATRAIEGTGPVDKDLSKLMARGLDRASFDSEIRPAVIDATRELGRVGGAIEESGFIGAGVRGLEAIPVVGKLPGKALEATGRGLQRIPGLRTVGAAIEGVGERGIGKGVGSVGRALLDGRQQSERVFRLATFKHAKAKGFSDAEALNEVVKFWGDFSQLTKVEKKVLRGFVLFFSWQLRALKMSGHQIIDHPFRTRLMLSLMAGNVTDREDFPDWIRRQGGWVMGRDLAGNPRTIDLGAGSVHGPLQDLLQGEVSQRLRTDGLSGVPTGIAQTALRRLTPMFQAPIEYATNYDSFSQGQIRLESGQDTAKTRTSDHAPASMWWVAQYFPKIAEALDLRPVNKADGTLSYIHMDPTYNWLFNKVAPGIGAQLGPANALADPRKEMWEAASRAFFGTPTYSIREQDLKSRVGAKVRTMTDALRKSVAGTGLAVNQYGGVYFDKSSPVGAEMIADNERWAEEAKREKLNPDAYKRLKMGSKYQKQLYLIDFGRYLNGWTDALDAPFPKLKPGKDATAGLRRLGRDEAKRDLRRR